jgi:hypothetical protein
MTRGLPLSFVVLTASLAVATPALGQSALEVSVSTNGTPSNVPSGGSVNLTAGGIGQAVLATATVRYTGTSSATITALSFTGAPGIALAGTSTPPVTLSPNGTTSFLIQYLPETGNVITGQVSIGFTENNQSSIFTFTVNGTAPDLAFTSVFLPKGTLTDLTPGSLITFPATNLGSSTAAVVNIVNHGSATSSLQSVSLTGVDYQVTGSTLPAAVSVGQQVSFNVVFTPHAAATSPGSLTVGWNSGSITFFLSGLGTTPDLSVSYALADGNSRPLSDGTAITFPTVDVNTSTSAAITIFNQGTGSGTVTGLSVTGTGFLLTGSPILPATIGAGQNLRFGIVFAPAQIGNFVGTYSINFGGRAISGTLIAATNTPSLALSYALADGIAHTLSDGSAITFPSVDINATTTATVTILNHGTGTGAVTGFSLAGSGFQLSGTPQLPASIAANQSVQFGIVFAPSKAGGFSGTFRIDLTGRSISGILTASTASSNFSLSYIDPDTGNILRLTNNSTLPFPNTLVGATFSITLIAANTGAGTGSINSIIPGSSASAFQPLALPALPLSVPPSQQFRFAVRFSPQQQQNYSDTLRIDLNGQTLIINLQAQGTQPQFTYGLASGMVTTLFSAGGTVAMPDTAIGQTAGVGVSVYNFGTGDGQISTISVTGPGFSLTDLPTVPFTLHPNGSQRFTLNFAPAQPVVVSGRLTVGSDTFTVTATGIGPRLTYTYTSAASTIPIVDSGVIIFPPLGVANSENLSFSVHNTGTGATTISTINLTAPGGGFVLSQLPALPINLDPGTTITFPIGFVPNNIGSLTGTLRVNNSSFNLSGTGTQPAALPNYQLESPTGNQLPAQQLTIGLTLASPYPLALEGTLTLTFVSAAFIDDPSVQFASGGRTVSFNIPANSVQALFGGNATSLALQTGTTVGSIVITPAFAMQGGFDLTPSSPSVLTLTIQRSAPQLLSASVTSKTLSSFSVVLNGYSTTHAIRQLDIRLTPQSGQTFSATHLTIDVSSASSAWFQSTASKGFGGSFLVTIPFALSNGNTTDDLVQLLQSLSITATNDVGTSSEVSVSIP